MLFAFSNLYRKKFDASTFFLVWFFVTLARVSYPTVIVYGGIRHFLEIVPAMALLAGFGCYEVYKRLEKRKAKLFGVAPSLLFTVLLVLGFTFTLGEFVWCHPFEYTYHNAVTDLVTGQSDVDAAYLRSDRLCTSYGLGVDWLNENAEPNATVGVPRIWCSPVVGPYLRDDLHFVWFMGKDFFEGYNQVDQKQGDVIAYLPLHAEQGGKIGQTFLPSKASITGVELFAYAKRAPNGDLIVEIARDSNGMPGEVIASEIIPLSSFQREEECTSWHPCNLNIDFNETELTQSEVYWIVLSSNMTNADARTNYFIGYNSRVDAYTDGSLSLLQDDAAASPVSYDLAFATFSSEPSVSYVMLSCGSSDRRAYKVISSIQETGPVKTFGYGGLDILSIYKLNTSGGS
jgi:hypothetical protein